MSWVDARERLPPHIGPWLTWNGRYFRQCRFDNDRYWRDSLTNQTPLPAVLYWAPLPQIPGD